MEQIEHKFVEVDGGLKLHVADIGAASDKVLLFLHGFPEIWYSWRHQMISLSKSGYRAIAVDYRGYGLSDPPPRTEDATFANIVADLVAILDSLNVPKVVLVGKDFGVYVASWFNVVHPERVLGFVTMGTPFRVPGNRASVISSLPEGFYVSRWREPGRAEAEFGRLDAKTVVRNVYILFSGSELPIAAENQEIMDLVDPSAPLPTWFTEEDLEAYGALYQKSGFQTALKIPYRSLDEQLEVPMPAGVKLNVPALLIVGGKDYTLKMTGIEHYINNMVKEIVPDLKTVRLAEGSHFVQEQLPEEVNQLILDFLKARIWP
ncbi:unnamed protein product [Linum tenue]|uniref:AB hydrolase-1 domain-containing protein n=1 Tax=Linum tenue TaxID=586396 RepID=A0AAV0JC09_9ROSI|nr:unnamed protein product [Linum tenue]